MDLQRIASRVAILFGGPTLKVDMARTFYIYDGIYFKVEGKRGGKRLYADVIMDFFGARGEGEPDQVVKVDNFQMESYDPYGPDWKMFEEAVRNSSDYKDLVQAYENPTPGQQSIITNVPKNITVHDFLDA